MPRTAEPATTAGSAVPPCSVTSRARDPPFFAGLPGDDVEDLLDEYNRISSFNRLDDAFKLRNVSLSLRKVAKTWFYNPERDFTYWQQFTFELRLVLDTSSTRTEAAKKKLDENIQLPGESYTSYIEDVLALCHRANKDMTKDSRVRHVLKGNFPFAFNALVAQNPTSVNQVVTMCQRHDDRQSLRGQPTQWDTRASMDEADLGSMI